jgi:hypothetical protein
MVCRKAPVIAKESMETRTIVNENGKHSGSARAIRNSIQAACRLLSITNFISFPVSYSLASSKDVFEFSRPWFTYLCWQSRLGRENCILFIKRA